MSADWEADDVERMVMKPMLDEGFGAFWVKATPKWDELG